ncbi:MULTISPECIES: cysteine/glutathione ABC transporter permease/ATP-binding protein CydD [unclassified Endozoicomonas]|uniref:heme ABC transporter permease/ATP-binding protein CydD n=1 Tax=unclassified Endozoicomonas TaxID=2644528 RepID=UPI002148DB30|nr:MULTISPECIES: cysteine/glutathione ABC transporter permease/ATP-binding protein CydD [unclassified Endozoicomonas]
MRRITEKRAYKWLIGQLSPTQNWLLASIILGLINGLLFLAQASLLAKIIHQIVMEDAVRASLIHDLMLTVMIIVLRALCHWGREITGFRAGLVVREVIRGAILNKLKALGPLVIAEQPAGSWSTMVVEQVEELQEFVARYIPQMALAVLIPLVILIVAFPMNWTAGLIFLGTAPLIPVFMALVGIKAAEANRRNFRALNRLGGFFLDRLQGMETLRLFQRTRHEHESLKTASEDFRHKTMQVLRLAFLSSTVLEFFASVSIAILAVYLGMSFLGYLNFGSYGAGVSLYSGLFLLLLAPEFYQPLRDLGTHYHAKSKAVGAAELILETLEREESRVHQGKGSLAMETPVSLNAERLTVQGSVEGRALLKEVSFDIATGERVAIIGPSGAGKSTLVNTLMGFWNYQGKIRVAGEDLSSFSMDNWRKRIAWLGQQPMIIHGTVYENVSLGRDLDESQVNRALAKAQAMEIVEQLPEGLNALLQEQGGNLSVGQAQRIALARAIAEPVKLLILDEPTASLDAYNERLVLDALEAIDPECTVITVTHRLKQIDSMDRVLMLENGQLVADGEPGVLKRESAVVQAFVAGLAGSLDNE